VSQNMNKHSLWETLSTLSDDTVETWIHKHRDQLDLETLQTLKAKAEQISEQGDIDTALKLFERGALVAQALNDPLAMGLIWRGRAIVFQRYEHYEQSLAATHQAVDLYEQHGTEFDVAAARVIEIYVLGALERFDEAIELGHWIRPRFARENSQWAKLGLAKVAANLGAIYAQSWRLEQAMQELGQAAQLYQELGMPEQVAWVFHDMGLTASQMDQLGLAKQYYAQAHADLAAAGYVFLLTRMQFNLAMICIRQGQYEQALDRLLQARVELSRLPDAPDHAFVDLFESQVRRALNQPEQGEALLRRALATFERLDRRTEIARVLLELGCLLAARRTPDELAEGLSCLERAEVHLDDLDMPLLTAWLQLEQGEILLRLGRVTQAARQAQAGRVVFGEAGLSLRCAQADALLADCCWRLQPYKARHLYASALQTAGQDQPLVAARGWHGLGKLAAAAGDVDAAEQAYEKAIALLENVRRSLCGHSHQAGFLEDKQGLIEELLAALHTQAGREYSVLAWVEQFKARVLADLLAEQPPDSGSDPKLLDLLARRKQLRRQLDRRLSSLLDQSHLAEMRQRGPSLAAHDDYQTHELSSVRQQLQALEEQIVWQRDNACDWREGAPIDPRQMHCLLDEQTLLVSYYAAAGRLYALTVTHVEGDVRIHALHLGTDEVEERWWQTRRLVARPTSRVTAVQARLARLWEGLIAPLDLQNRLRDGTRLLILPHRGLFHVPFAGLYDAQGGQYLVERWSVQLAPSATILERCQRRERGALQHVLVGYPGSPGQPGYLPGVEEEIQTLAGILPRATVLLGEEATMDNVMAVSPKSQVLHLAGHAFYDNTNPLESGMPLAGGRWLRAADLYLHYGHLDGATVVLSGCSAGRGRPSGGDVMGLTSAFLYAGAVGVVAGLWRVDDAATADLMTNFYRELDRGATDALRLAQLGLLHSERYAHPYFWAPFALSGASDGR
jgi:CHAT domain-containing protein